MKLRHFTQLVVAFGLLLAIGVGCKKDIPPPTALPVEQFAAEFQKTFANAKSEIKDLANQIVTAVQAKDYSKAFGLVQNLTATPGLSKDQQNLIARALMTVNEQLAAAQTQGDQNAAQTVETYRRNK